MPFHCFNLLYYHHTFKALQKLIATDAKKRQWRLARMMQLYIYGNRLKLMRS